MLKMPVVSEEKKSRAPVGAPGGGAVEGALVPDPREQPAFAVEDAALTVDTSRQTLH